METKLDLELFKEVIDNANDIVVVTEAAPLAPPGPRIVYVNRAFETLTGYSSAEVLGRSPRLLQGPGTAEETRREIGAALREQRPIHTTILNYAKNGQAYWLDIKIVPLFDQAGELRYFAAIERDLTEKKTLEDRLRTLATTDALTGLNNRRRVFELAEAEVRRATRYGHGCSLLMLDIDHFKQVNDSYGHPAGDAVITALAQILRETLREVDVIGRIGGEEFVALLPETDRDLAMRTAERLRSSLYAHRHPVTTPAINVSVSIGVATRIEDEPSLERMLLRADAALYAAKDAGRNCVKLAE